VGHDHCDPNGLVSTVSIIIPTRDRVDLLRQCIESIQWSTSELAVEIVVVDNCSVELETQAYLSNLAKQGVKVLKFDEEFNFSKINNFAASRSSGKYLCFLNNDTKALNLGWLSAMVSHAKQPNIGLVGAVLFYPDSRIQHAGLALGHRGIASSPFKGFPASEVPAHCFSSSAVTFACAVTSKERFLKLSGMDERFAVGLNDVDLCLRATNAGLKNVLCVEARLAHLEYASRSRMTTLKGARTAILETIRYLNIHGQRVRDEFIR
jgi:GT2 family glycosyltransferase